MFLHCILCIAFIFCSITDSGHDTNSTFGTSHTNTSEITGTLGKINTNNNKHLSYNYDDTLPKVVSYWFGIIE